LRGVVARVLYGPRFFFFGKTKQPQAARACATGSALRLVQTSTTWCLIAYITSSLSVRILSRFIIW